MPESHCLATRPGEDYGPLVWRCRKLLGHTGPHCDETGPTWRGREWEEVEHA